MKSEKRKMKNCGVNSQSKSHSGIYDWSYSGKENVVELSLGKSPERRPHYGRKRT
jgi:hypothetical protein